MIYLASPYSDDDWRVKDSRWRSVCRAAGALMRAGHFIFSPIAHTHPIAMECDLPTGFEYWERYDIDMIRSCDEVWILTLDGWLESKGVTFENEFADNIGLPVRYVNRHQRTGVAKSFAPGAAYDSEWNYIITKLRPLQIEAAD